VIADFFNNASYYSSYTASYAIVL